MFFVLYQKVSFTSLLNKSGHLYISSNIMSIRSFFFLCLKVDLDLGNYERFLDIKLTRDNNITTGKIYQVCD